MTEYERARQMVNRRIVAELDDEQSRVIVRGSRLIVVDSYTNENVAIDYRDDLRAAFLADFCRLAGIKTPKARK